MSRNSQRSDIPDSVALQSLDVQQQPDRRNLEMKDVLPPSFTQNAGRNDGLTGELSQVPRQSL